MKGYSVNLWGSHPDAGNDDCWTGIDDIATYEEALAIARGPASRLRGAATGAWTYVQILGPDEDDLTSDVQVELLVEKNPKARRADVRKCDRDDDDLDWRREQAMEAGMLHGVNAYNDAMGYGIDDDGGY